ncbi:alpha/beta fold hydrolase [Nesterenkonia sedimenti]|nr:alpha/beta hydrolase [Nesterenkonia sedimenti]
MFHRVDTLACVSKTATTTPARFLPTPWVNYPRREASESRLDIRLETAGQQVGTEVGLWTYSPHQEKRPAKPPRILLIHGFRGDHHGMQLIADALPEYEVFVPDLPGYGLTQPLRGADGTRTEHTVELYAKFVEALAEKLGLGPGDLLLGHSFGTIVCSAHAALHRREWAGLALSAPVTNNVFAGRLLPGAAVVELYYRLSQLLPETAGNAFLRSPTILEVTNVTLGVGWDQKLTDYVRDQHRQFFGGYTDRQTLLESYRASSRYTVADFAAQIDLPTLLLPGAKDNLSTVAGRMAVRDALPQGQLEIIRGSGHLVHYEKPVQVARAVRRFGREVGVTGA